MKNFKGSIKDTLSAKYSETDVLKSSNRSTDINILLKIRSQENISNVKC